MPSRSTKPIPHTATAAATGAVLSGIAAVIPSETNIFVLIDAGANSDAKPEHLLQYGIMGSVYSRHVLGYKNPSIGLMSIGEEDTIMRLLLLIPLAALLLAAMAAQSEDLHLKKNISVGGNVVSSSETSIKGQRTRDVTQTPAGATVSLRQCDLKRTVTLNDQTQTYMVVNDPQDAAAARAAARRSA